MKKLIIAAVVAAMGVSAFAACTYKPIKEVAKTAPAWAYKWKFSGKTTKAVTTTCARGTKGSAYITRTSTSLKIQGWSFYCEPNCGDFEAAEADEIFWQTKPFKTLLDGGVTLEVANVIGKKGKNYEAFGVAEFKDLYTLYFAGFGKYDSKNERVSSIKGNFAGTAAAPALTAYNKANCDYDTDVSKVWECCGCPTAEADSVAFGKWSVKYSKSYAKKYGNDKLDLSKVLPKWAR